MPLADKTPGGYTVLSGLHGLLEAVVTRLLACRLIEENGIVVIHQHSADLYNYLKRVIEKTLGICAVVSVTRADHGTPSMAPMLREVRIRVAVHENVFLNQSSSGTKIPALTVAEASLPWLHYWTAPSDINPNAYVLTMAQNDTLKEDTSSELRPGGVITWAANFETRACVACAECEAEEEAP